MNTQRLVLVFVYFLFDVQIYSQQAGSRSVQQDTVALTNLPPINLSKNNKFSLKRDTIYVKGSLSDNQPKVNKSASNKYGYEKEYIRYRFSKKYPYTRFNPSDVNDTSDVNVVSVIPDNYIELGIIVGVPKGAFHRIVEKNGLVGLRLGLMFNPTQNKPNWHTGIGAEVYPTFRRSDSWHGGELKTAQTYYRINIINRIKLSSNRSFSPYLELGVGIFGSSTSSFYSTKLTVINDDEKEIEYAYRRVTANLSLGFGLMIGKTNLEINYELGPSIKYVKRDNVTVTMNSINYEISESSVQTFVFGIAWMIP